MIKQFFLYAYCTCAQTSGGAMPYPGWSVAGLEVPTPGTRSQRGSSTHLLTAPGLHPTSGGSGGGEGREVVMHPGFGAAALTGATGAAAAAAAAPTPQASPLGGRGTGASAEPATSAHSHGGGGGFGNVVSGTPMEV